MSDSLHDRRWPDQTAEFLANEATRSTSVTAVRGGEESVASEPTPPRFGRYVLLEQLGSDGTAEVYRALHARLHKQVTLKRLPPERANDAEARARFEREVRLISRLTHPNIVRLENAGELDGQPFMVTEHVDGIDLETLIARVGPLRSEDACQLVGQAALGLAHLAEHGFVHRDIRPSSLILSSSGALKIADFSAAQSAEDDCDFPIGMKALGRTLLTLLSGNSSFDGAEAVALPECCDRPLPPSRRR
ncbi:MAG: serine/threonine protein kinase [Planctomycetales bacterium]|nr:serine/threonine protein kinase [Planctomycetales bacterium]